MAKVKLWNVEKGTYMFECPAGHTHYINTKVPNQQNAQWGFNGNLDRPTFSPSINEKTGYYVDPNTKGDEQWLKDNSYQCHFFVRDGKIIFCSDCSHSLKGTTVELTDI